MSEKKFYVYVHKYASGPKEGRVFYVGKGSGHRYKSKQGRNKRWNDVFRKYGFISEIVMRFDIELCSFSIEVALINFYGLENLVNISIGGEGPSGSKWSDEKRLLFCKPVYNSKGEVFKSLTEAGMSYGGVGAISNICGSISGSQKSAYKATWAFLGNGLESFIEPNTRRSMSRGTKVYCSNGKEFHSFNAAARWVAENGYPKAKHEPIRLCALGRIGSAYGFTWSLDGRCIEYVDRVKRISESRKKIVRCSNGMIFNSLLDAVDWLVANGRSKASSSKLSLVANGKRKIAYGYKWEYVNGTKKQ